MIYKGYSSSTADPAINRKLRRYDNNGQPSVCSDNECSELLNTMEKRFYDSCSRTAHEPIEPSKCSFLATNYGPPTALASSRGSGSTWIRWLLQQATGYCTGSIYCDGELRTHGFPGENIRSGSVLVTNTHKIFPKVSLSTDPLCRVHCSASFTKAILVVRDPFMAIIAEWDRKSNKYDHFSTSSNQTVSSLLDSSHVPSNAGEKYFGKCFFKNTCKHAYMHHICE